MKFKRRLRIEAGLTQIDFVSFVNVAFLLIIFFLLTSSLVTTSGMVMSLPRLLSADMLGPHVLSVVIDSHNDIHVKGEPIKFEGLAKVIREGRFISIFIQADARSSLDMIGQVYQLCQTLGIERIGLATTRGQ